MSPTSRNFFTDAEKEKILNAILEAEDNTSGEIRLHLENECEEDVLDRAAFIFKKLKMDKTAARNGVLFYLAIDSKKFAIIGDKGINAVVPEGFWNKIKDELLKDFSEGKFSEGLVKGIKAAGENLKKHFPHQSDDVNELSDDISFG